MARKKTEEIKQEVDKKRRDDLKYLKLQNN